MSKERLPIPNIDELMRLHYEKGMTWAEIRQYVEEKYEIVAHLSTIRSRVAEYMRRNRIRYDSH